MMVVARTRDATSLSLFRGWVIFKVLSTHSLRWWAAFFRCPSTPLRAGFRGCRAAITIGTQSTRSYSGYMGRANDWTMIAV